MDPSKLVRLRANPKKVRVSIGHFTTDEHDWWRVTVQSLEEPEHKVIVYAREPRAGVVKALRGAWHNGMPGIDLGMGWAYPHPQRH